MSNKGIKVSIDGVGGDEILSGYPSFLSLANSNLIKNQRIQTGAPRILAGRSGLLFFNEALIAAFIGI